MTIAITRRSALVAAGLVASLVAGAGVVAADTPIGHGGQHGAHYLADNEDNPGVECLYDSGNVLESVRVKAPFIYARDRTTGTDEELVGWRVIIQRSDPPTGPSGWTTIARTSYRVREASDAAVAPFAGRSVAVDGTASRSYRIVIKMTWLGSDPSTTEGFAKHLVDWYVGAAFVPSFGPAGYCPGGVF